MGERAASSHDSPGLPNVIAWTFTGLCILGVVALLIFSLTQPSAAGTLGVLAAGLLLAAAALVLGGLLGFLFGIPRSLQAPRENEQGILGENSRLNEPPTVGTQANTNLEQISDWLTKILVGVGLTQLGQLGPALTAVSAFFSPAFGESPNTQPVVLAAVLFYLVGGFLIGYFWTRVYLPGAFRWAEEQRFRMVEAEVKEAEQRASEAIQRVESARAEARDAARAALKRDVREYKMVRDQPSGPERTASMTNVLAAMRHRIREAELTHDEIIAWGQSTDEGERILALAAIQDEPDVRYGRIVIDMIANSKSAFEQYQALRAAEQLASLLDDSQKSRLREVVEEQFSTGWLQHGKNTNAMPLGSAVLAELGAR